MITLVEIKRGYSLDDYASNAHLRPAVDDLRTVALALAPRLEGKKVWMINSTAQGGGVAEMLPRVVGLLEEVGVETKWAVIGTDDPSFFSLTKRLHNLVHDSGDPTLGENDRALYEKISAEIAAELIGHLGPDDVLVAHDPQPAAIGALIKEQAGIPTIWRCHIGVDRETERTRAVWTFLRPWIEKYDHCVFSAPQYIPGYLSRAVSVVHPALDPLSHKNRELSPVKLTGILTNSGLVPEHAPVVTPAFERQPTRLQPDGTFGVVNRDQELGLLFRPMITQVSRWDRLKGWRQLLEGFALLKDRLSKGEISGDDRQLRRLEIARLILAGPDPRGVGDDPEAQDVLDELSELYRGLHRERQEQIAILSLPMENLKNNHLMVNALQRSSSIAVQNSIEEGFGLVVAEAMWKRTPVLGSTACGIRQQIRDHVDGRLILDATDPVCVADTLTDMLRDPHHRAALARTAQRRVHDEFLVFRQIRRWLEVLVHCVTGRRSSAPPPPS